jgi:hypothetical protein
MFTGALHLADWQVPASLSAEEKIENGTGADGQLSRSESVQTYSS